MLPERVRAEAVALRQHAALLQGYELKRGHRTAGWRRQLVSNRATEAVLCPVS